MLELHLRLGFINNLVKELITRWPSCTNEEDPFWKFCDEHRIKKSTYWGNALEGPQILLLLEKLDLLERTIPRRVPGSDFIAVLRSFEVLYSSCFQMSLNPSWQDHIDVPDFFSEGVGGQKGPLEF